jgi:hypothetical protein
MFFEDAAICLCFCVPQAKKGLRITDGVAEIKRYTVIQACNQPGNEFPL